MCFLVILDIVSLSLSPPPPRGGGGRGLFFVSVRFLNLDTSQEVLDGPVTLGNDVPSDARVLANFK